MNKEVIEAQTKFCKQFPGLSTVLSIQRKDASLFFISGKIVDANGSERSSAHELVEINEQKHVEEGYLTVIRHLWQVAFSIAQPTQQNEAKPPAQTSEPKDRNLSEGRSQRDAARISDIDKGIIDKQLKTITDGLKCNDDPEDPKGVREGEHYDIAYQRDDSIATVVLRKNKLYVWGATNLSGMYGFTEGEDGTWRKTVTASGETVEA